MSDKIFVLKSDDGGPLKLNSAVSSFALITAGNSSMTDPLLCCRYLQADVEPYIAILKGNTTVEEIRLGGNTLGIDACKTIGEYLKSNINLKVRRSTPEPPLITSGLPLLPDIN